MILANLIGDEGAGEIADALKVNQGLTKLDLGGTIITLSAFDLASKLYL